MALDFDQFPIYDPAIIPDTMLFNALWQSFFGTFHETLISYLSQNGIFIPSITTEERDALKNVQEGQMIYNSTLGKFEGFEPTGWMTFTTT